MITKNKYQPLLHERKWFKMLCLFAFAGFLFYVTRDKTIRASDRDLVQVNATADAIVKPFRRDGMKMAFRTIGNQSLFGIRTGGIFGRYTEINDALAAGNRISVKIDRYYSDSLNKEGLCIPIYYLATEQSGLVFDEHDFDEGNESSHGRFVVLVTVIFIIGFFRIIFERRETG